GEMTRERRTALAPRLVQQWANSEPTKETRVAGKPGSRTPPRLAGEPRAASTTAAQALGPAWRSIGPLYGVVHLQPPQTPRRLVHHGHLPWRWLVDQTICWLSDNRRLTRDGERC